MPLGLHHASPRRDLSWQCGPEAPADVLGWDPWPSETRHILVVGFVRGQIQTTKFQGFSQEPVTNLKTQLSADK